MFGDRNMSFIKDHERRVAAFPVDIKEAHKHSANHRVEINNSTMCGCFCCKEIYVPERIEIWTDVDDSGEGQTALCPSCGIDSVLGDKSGFPITKEFLSKMKRYWF